MTKKRKQYRPQCKAKVALEAIRGDKIVPELASLYKTAASNYQAQETSDEELMMLRRLDEQS